MNVTPLEVYATDSNYAIVKPPGRNYPGCVIQGDSLSILCRAAQRIARYCRDQHIENEDLLDDVETLNNSLVGRILHYQQVLDLHSIDYPHVYPFTEEDVVELLPRNEGDD